MHFTRRDSRKNILRPGQTGSGFRPVNRLIVPHDMRDLVSKPSFLFESCTNGLPLLKTCFSAPLLTQRPLISLIAFIRIELQEDDHLVWDYKSSARWRWDGAEAKSNGKETRARDQACLLESACVGFFDNWRSKALDFRNMLRVVSKYVIRMKKTTLC